MFSIKRIYDEPGDDGYRVLVDRLWPRGMSKEEAKLDDWNKDIAPSSELRGWFDHDPKKFSEFSARYEKELETSDALNYFQTLAHTYAHITLLYGAKDPSNNQAVVLCQYIEQRIKH